MSRKRMFWIQVHNGWVEVEGQALRLKVPGFEKLRFFRHRDEEDRWCISKVQTGLRWVTGSYEEPWRDVLNRLYKHIDDKGADVILASIQKAIANTPPKPSEDGYQPKIVRVHLEEKADLQQKVARMTVRIAEIDQALAALEEETHDGTV